MFPFQEGDDVGRIVGRFGTSTRKVLVLDTYEGQYRYDERHRPKTVRLKTHPPDRREHKSMKERQARATGAPTSSAGSFGWQSAGHVHNPFTDGCLGAPETRRRRGSTPDIGARIYHAGTFPRTRGDEPGVEPDVARGAGMSPALAGVVRSPAGPWERSGLVVVPSWRLSRGRAGRT